jgi:hypothetical protein
LREEKKWLGVGEGAGRIGAPELHQLARSHPALELHQDHGPEHRVRGFEGLCEHVFGHGAHGFGF